MEDVQRTLTAVALTLTAFLSGCSASDGMMSSVTLPAGETTPPASGTVGPGAQQPDPGATGPVQQSRLTVTAQQRGYLDALAAGGVHPSSDLRALSIGSYVCQARAAGQSPQAVWDYVHPLVANDVQEAHLSLMAPTAADVDAATESYIRIASDRLC